MVTGRKARRKVPSMPEVTKHVIGQYVGVRGRNSFQVERASFTEPP